MKQLRHLFFLGFVLTTFSACSESKPQAVAPVSSNPMKMAAEDYTGSDANVEEPAAVNLKKPTIKNVSIPAIVRSGEAFAVSVSAAGDNEFTALTYTISSANDLFSPQSSSTGLLQVTIPADTASQTATVTVAVSGNNLATATQDFTLSVQGAEQSKIGKVINDKCATLTDETYKAACEAVGTIPK